MLLGLDMESNQEHFSVKNLNPPPTIPLPKCSVITHTSDKNATPEHLRVLRRILHKSVII